MQAVNKIKDFIEVGLWETPMKELSSGRRFWYGLLKRIFLTSTFYGREQLGFQASALTYSTMLATVPLLAIIFAISRGFGFNKLIEDQIRANISGQPEAIDTVIGFVNSYLMHTKSGVFVGFGLLLLLWTLFTLVRTIEGTFNRIWQVKKSRTTFRMLTDYTALFLLLPIMLVVTSGLSIFTTTVVKQMSGFFLLGHTARLLIELSPYMFAGLAFTALYLFMPNTKVKLRSAFVSGMIAGIAFQMVQFFYIHSQMWVTGYNAIYGSFAALPLFMLWCQISWNICLFGAELSYVDQHIDYFYGKNETPKLAHVEHDHLCLVIASFVCRKFAQNEPMCSASQIAGETQIPISLINDTLAELCSYGVLLSYVEDEKGSETVYIPAKPLSMLTVGYLLEKLDMFGIRDDHAMKRGLSAWHTLTSLNQTRYSGMDADRMLSEL